MEFQRQLGLGRYETAFKLIHKIRSVMGKRDSLYLFQIMVEYDEAYVEKASYEQVAKQLKQGKGNQKQPIVAVACESTPLEEPETGKKKRDYGFFKMKVLKDASAGTVEGSFGSQTVLFTDSNLAYDHLERLVEDHIRVISSEASTKGDLNWVHKQSTIKKRTCWAFIIWQQKNTCRTGMVSRFKYLHRILL
ncbi:hypothetical protein GCM10028791_40220 [Echinicola sediminis]